ncbi:hypothetical protein [Haladaptatus sp. NG-SE-30]
MPLCGCNPPEQHHYILVVECRCKLFERSDCIGVHIPFYPVAYAVGTPSELRNLCYYSVSSEAIAEQFAVRTICPKMGKEFSRDLAEGGEFEI